MSLRIHLASSTSSRRPRQQRRQQSDGTDDGTVQLVTPGDVITRDSGFMRGHGTYLREGGGTGAAGGEESALVSSVAGAVQRVNKLVSVAPPRTKYQAEIGDVLVGRVTEVQQRRWKVEVNARLDAVLLLSSVNLPGGELRRRSAEDELAMRSYLQEGDLVSAEVQQLYSDGAASVHTRSLKYGKLSQGTLVKVSPSLVKRRKTHFHRLPCGVSVILGNNGFVWLSPTALEAEAGDEGAGGGFAQDLTRKVARSDRESISRLRSCVLSLAANGVMLWDTTLSHAFEASLKFSLPELLEEEAMSEVAEEARQRVRMEEGAASS